MLYRRSIALTLRDEHAELNRECPLPKFRHCSSLCALNSTDVVTDSATGKVAYATVLIRCTHHQIEHNLFSESVFDERSAPAAQAMRENP